LVDEMLVAGLGMGRKSMWWWLSVPDGCQNQLSLWPRPGNRAS
jgi:hypothetical protein